MSGHLVSSRIVIGLHGYDSENTQNNIGRENVNKIC